MPEALSMIAWGYMNSGPNLPFAEYSRGKMHSFEIVRQRLFKDLLNEVYDGRQTGYQNQEAEVQYRSLLALPVLDSVNLRHIREDPE